MKTLFTALSFALLISACGPKLTMEGAGVKVAEGIGDCKAIQGVEATAGSKEAAEIDLRNQAGAMGGNGVVVEETTENEGQVRLKGKAIKCGI